MPERRFKAHPQSAPGDFYVVNGECISCGAPHAVAPDLIGWAANSEYQHCIWKKQPETFAETEQAFAAFDASEVGCYRYAGDDPTIMERIGRDFCDHAPPVPLEVRSLSPPEFRPTLIEADRSIIYQFLKALLFAGASAFLIWLIATRFNT